MGKTIFFSVGEPSGDQHAARLIHALRQADPSITTRGFGGQKMRDAGCAVDLDLTEHAVVGILEVLPKLRQFFGFADQAEAIFKAGEVDAVVLVDFPGFNWHIAKRAKRLGIPVFYYCPPQLWAWGGWRVKKMRASVDHVLAVLPIELSYYQSHGVPTTFVGHPFFDAVADQSLNQAVCQQLRASAGSGPLVAVLPGSRTHEVHSNWPLMVEAMRSICHQVHGVRFAVAGYRSKQVAFCKEFLLTHADSLPVDFYEGCTSEIIEVSDAAMMVSGSVSLEMMARRTPAAVVYRVGRFLYAFGKCVVKVPSMTLPNLMPPESYADGKDSSNEPVYPEIVSVGNPAPASEFLAETVTKLLLDRTYRDHKCEQLDGLAERFAKPGASSAAASELIRLLGLRSDVPPPLSQRHRGSTSVTDSPSRSRA
ncbi:MAG: lipid-A-disaccharide synthase [Planctomycetota bacterium]